MEKPGDHPERSLRGMAHEALHDLVHFDTRLFRTLPALLFKPGKVTEAALEPGQTQYVRPFALFVFLNFLFFIVKAKGIFQYPLDAYRDRFEPFILDKAAELHISQQILTERFNTAMHFEQKEYFIVMVPLFALVLWLVTLTRPRLFALHLVFSLNYYAFLIAFLILIPWLLMPFQLVIPHGLLNTEMAFTLIILGVCFIYLVFALKRVYRNKWWLSAVQGALLSLATLSLIVFVYRTLLFFIVMHSIGE